MLNTSLSKPPASSPELPSRLSSNELIRRPRLENLIDEAEIVVVVAPGGYGKSTFATQWSQLRREAGESVIWLALSPEQSDPVLLLKNIASGLETTSRQHSAERGSQFDPQSGQDACFAEILDALELDTPCWLIVNDFHLIEGSSGATYIERLVEIADAKFRLFITSRNEPALNLATCATRGKLSWITEQELKFSREEIAQAAERLLPSIETKALEALSAASGGWPVLVTIALAALRHTSDNHGDMLSAGLARHGLIRSFVRRLLRETAHARSNQVLLEVLAALEQVSPALLDNLAPGGVASDTWHELVASGLVALRSEPQAPFSLHPVVREIILQEMADRTTQLTDIQNRAAEWYWQNGASEQAITYAIESANYAKAQSWLVESVEDLLRGSGQLETYLRYLGRLPTVYQQHPMLAYYKAWSLGLLRRYEEAEEAISNLPDTDEAAVLQNLMRATLAAFQDNAAAAFELLSTCSPLADDRLPDKLMAEGKQAATWTAMEVGIASLVTCYCRKSRGEFVEAHNARRMALTCFTLEHSSYARNWTAILGVQLLLKEGQFRNALAEARAAIASCPDGYGFAPLRGMLRSVEAFVLYERNDLDQAKAALDESLRFLHQQGIVDAIISGYVAAARVEAANNDFADALDLLAEGERIGCDRGFPRLEVTLRAERVQLLIRDGQYREGEILARRAGLLSFETATPLQSDKGLRIAVRLFRHGLEVIPKDLLAGRLQQAIAHAHTTGQRYKEADLLLQYALLAAKDGDEITQNAALERAVSLASTESYLRLFIDEGAPARDLLNHFSAKGVQGSGHIAAHLGRIMASFSNASTPAPAPLANGNSVAEKLSERELQILRLLAQGSSNQIIARRVYLTEGTVKWHLHNIYGKLDVPGRTAAVVFAQRIGLLGAPN